MDHPSHPFPYFGLDVTSDLNAVKAAVEAKFKIEWQFNTAAPERTRKFYDHAALLCVARDAKALRDAVKGKANFEPDPTKVNAIVEKCLKEIEPLFKHKVTWENTIHQADIDSTI